MNTYYCSNLVTEKSKKAPICALMPKKIPDTNAFIDIFGTIVPLILVGNS